MAKSLVEDDVVDLDRIELFGATSKVGCPVPDSLVNEFVVVELVRDRLVVALEKILVDAVLLAKSPHRCLEAMRDIVQSVLVQALVVDPVHLDDDARSPDLVRNTFSATNP